MNILFFLSPKQDLMYVYDDFTLRQTLEKWENNRYASIPVLNRRGEYVGTLTEGDILWASSLASCAGRPSSATATKSPARRKRRSPAVWCRNTPPPTERRKTTGPAMLHLPIFGRVEHFLCKNPRKSLESPIYRMLNVR